MNFHMKKWILSILLLCGCARSLAAEKGPLIIDVRTTREFKRAHVEGAIHIPYEAIGQEIAKHEPDHAREIIVYCASGARSEVAKEQLCALGYTAVTNGGSLRKVRKSRKEAAKN